MSERVPVNAVPERRSNFSERGTERPENQEVERGTERRSKF